LTVKESRLLKVKQGNFTKVLSTNASLKFSYRSSTILFRLFCLWKRL